MTFTTFVLIEKLKISITEVNKRIENMHINKVIEKIDYFMK